MDKDAEMLETLGNALTQLQIKYRAASAADRGAMKTSLTQVLSDYQSYQMKLIEDGQISTDNELAEMGQIRQEIDKAANTEQLITSLTKVLSFVSSKI